jgi:hypothetical protein
VHYVVLIYIEGIEHDAALEYGWQRAHFTRVPAGKNPIGCGFGCEFVPMSTGTSLILHPTGFFLMGMKMLYPCSQTRIPACVSV